MRIETPYFAAHDAHAIYGTGSSRLEAVGDAAEAGAEIDDLRTPPISEDLCLWIMEHGWDGASEAFETRDGELVRTTEDVD